MIRSVLFDTETTGLDPLNGDRLIEIAALELINDLPTGRLFPCADRSAARHSPRGHSCAWHDRRRTWRANRFSPR